MAAPPPLPIRERVFANIQTTLASITTGAGYGSTMALVVRGHKSPLEHFSFPCASLLGATDPIKYSLGTKRHNLLLAVRCWIDATQATAATQLEVLLADIVKAMEVDTHRGGYADATLEGPTQYLYQEATERLWGADIDFEIEYRTSVADPRIGV